MTEPKEISNNELIRELQVRIQANQINKKEIAKLLEINTDYFCEMCESMKGGEPIIRKVDSPFHKSTHGKVCKICPNCAPFTKEWNEAQDRVNNNPLKYWQ